MASMWAVIAPLTCDKARGTGILGISMTGAHTSACDVDAFRPRSRPLAIVLVIRCTGVVGHGAIAYPIGGPLL